MNIINSIKHQILRLTSARNYSTSQDTFQKSVQVCILGAHTPLGKFTSFLLKQNPVVSLIRMQGELPVDSMAVELGHIDTKCKVQAFEGEVEIGKAVRSADIVLILGQGHLKENTNLADRVMSEGRRIYDIAKECTVFAPRSLIIVCAPPVSVFTPLLAGVFKETNWYNPRRIIGSAAIAQSKANTFLARYLDLDPHMCQVPIIGGPDVDLAVPLFSRAKPVELSERTAKIVCAKYRSIREDEFPKKISKENFIENCPLSEAFAINNMITSIALGICGDKQAYCNAFMRSNVIDTCQHLVTTLQFSRGGAVHNYGVPQLTKLELKMFERAALQIKEREQMARDFIKYVELGRSEPPPFQQKEIEKKKILKQTVLRV